ncbi:non-SMC mitotic condensation complex subunit 1-domain-containing protein [Gorgonomyces haynaldii]|nr:non-SMC mitotic condensation complex subunit 1-domain-containing protein [Gorgonomyces haynaldii]
MGEAKQPTEIKKNKKRDFDWSTLRMDALVPMQRLTLLDLDRIFTANAERDLVLGMIYKSISLMLENPETLKKANVRDTLSDILCHCVAQYKTSQQVLKSRILDEYLREEHLAQFVAEMVDTCVVQYQYSDICDSILVDLCSRSFNDKEKATKAVGKFLTHLSERQPKELLKNMAQLIQLLDSEAYSIRCAIIDILGHIIHSVLAKDDSEAAAKTLESFYDILSQRFMDVNFYVRARVLKTIQMLAQRHDDAPAITDIPFKTRSVLIDLSIKRLKDKASLVRKRAIELMTQFIETSPFIFIDEDKGTLSEKHFADRVQQLTEALGQETEPEQGDEPKKKLQGLLNYYEGGFGFIQQIKRASDIICELLGSSVKTEVVAAMRFFVIAHRFDMECAQNGILCMVHKIWEKDTSDSEIGSIRDHLIRNFVDIHMNPPNSPSNPEKIIASALISLVSSMDLAQQTSLDQLLFTMAQRDLIPDSLSAELWLRFASRSLDVNERKFSLVLIGMIGRAKKEIIAERLDVLTRIGLGELSNEMDVAKYCCIAILQMLNQKREKGSLAAPQARQKREHPTVVRLLSLLLQPSTDLKWLGFAEQAINCLYEFVEHPDVLCGEIIQKMTAKIFRVSESADDQMSKVADMLSTMQFEDKQESQETFQSSVVFDLCQLVFVVGHVALKQIVYLEAIESEYKRRKHLNGTQKKTNDLEMVTGSVEDEFADRVQFVREKELLFGPKSLLTVFGRLLTFISVNHSVFKSQILHSLTMVSLVKFCCVSASFCETHLELIFKTLQSGSPTIRSNIVIGLGDLAISFNSLIDPNIQFLYQRLEDPDFTVKKNAFMVLTFLILNGMIKVKGQISEMAKCLEDEDTRIRNMAKLFFTELALKDNAIYNNLPDILSNLVSVPQQKYHKIIKYIMGFITKERQNEAIVEKLCYRFKSCDTERAWTDVGYCLSLLSFGTEKSLKKLQDALPLYSDKLYSEQLFKNLNDILNKIKTVGKPELKALAESFRETLQQAHVKSVENHTAAQGAMEDKQRIGTIVLPTIERQPEPEEVVEEEKEERESEATLSEKETPEVTIKPKSRRKSVLKKKKRYYSS